MSGSLAITPDRAKGFIGIEGKGVWSVEQLQAHFRQLRAAVAGMRAHAPHLKVLIDLREAGPQSTEAEELIRDENLDIYEPLDRVAMLIALYLHKEELRPLAEQPNRRLFADPVAALRWLNADHGEDHG
ncbi:MAG: hypothetical protein QM690_20545 [Sphingobium sp.]